MARSSTGPTAGILALAVAVVLVVVGWLLWPDGEGAVYRAARATVVQAADCGPGGGRDTVLIDLDGIAVRAELDGCGHRPGEVVTVEVPEAAALRNGMTVRLAGTGVSTGMATEQRLAAVGAVLAGAAGAMLAWRLYRRPSGRGRHLW
ncbi:MAG: hypothetical protein ACRDRZ_13975 [Pseudonocardiaceae bacterium]